MYHCAIELGTDPAQTPSGTAYTNAFARFLTEAPRVEPAQLEAYLQKLRRSPESLLGAYYATCDKSNLREAMEKYPNDPRVCLLGFYKSGVIERETATPAERQKWLEAFKQAAPENALANYLAAAERFSEGQTDLALDELLMARQKDVFTDYSSDYAYLAEEAYRAAGWSEAEAKVAAVAGLPLPHLAYLKKLAQQMVELANWYSQSGETATAQAVLSMALELGKRLDQPGAFGLIHRQLGIMIQHMALSALDANSPFGPAGQTVQEQLDALQRRRQALPTLEELVSVLETVPDEDLVPYFRRVKLFGEENALRWLENLYGPVGAANR